MDLMDFVKTFMPNLKEIPLEQIVKFMSVVQRPKGTKLISEGKQHSKFYFIVKGAAKSYYAALDKKLAFLLVML